MILVVFTSSYPYDFINEKTFHGGEMRILRKHFDRIIYVPRNAVGNLQEDPEFLEIDASYSHMFSPWRQALFAVYSLFTQFFYEDLKDRYPASLSIGYIRRLISFLSGAYLTRQWVRQWFKNEGVSDLEVVFYTFWFDEVPTGIGLAKPEYPHLRLVSKAHGFDIYEELYRPWPLRKLSISMLDGLFADSDMGNSYFRKKYPEFENRYQVSLLGVPDPGGISYPSADHILRIVSCSTTAGLKRLDLLLEGVITAAHKRPNQRFEWIHFGDGPDREIYIERINAKFPPNAKGFFPGYTSVVDLMDYYLNNPIDAFVNISKTEGTSVAIMEAISCGIPVIATAVGGNVEIVQEKNGMLLSENPTPDEIADALLSICDNREVWLEKRKGSREVWQERYSETTNFEAFAQALVEIRKR